MESRDDAQAADPPRAGHRRFDWISETTVPMIWLTEVYTPTTVPDLLDGLRTLLDKREGDADRSSRDPVELVQSTRRHGRGGARFPPVVPDGSEMFAHDRIVDAVPHGVTHVCLIMLTLTSTITVVTAGFRLGDEQSRMVDTIFNRDEPRRLDVQHGIMSAGPWQHKRLAVEQWRSGLREDCARWLTRRVPGSFQRFAPDRPPTIELVLTERPRRIAPRLDPLPLYYPGPPLHLLFPSESGYWQCMDMPFLRLQERELGVRDEVGVGRGLPKKGWPAQSHVLTLAGLVPLVLTDLPMIFGPELDVLEGLDALEIKVIPFACRWALTAFLRELEERFAIQQDVADRSLRRGSPRALRELQQVVTRMGIDSGIVGNDIVRFAENETSWRRDVLDFTRVSAKNADDVLWAMPKDEASRAATWDTPSSLLDALRGIVRFAENKTSWRRNVLDFTRVSAKNADDVLWAMPKDEASRAATWDTPSSLLDALRSQQVDAGRRVAQTELNLRELLSTSGNLTAAAANLRLQRGVLALAVLSLLIATIAAAAAVLALRHTNPAPSPQPSVSSLISGTAIVRPALTVPRIERTTAAIALSRMNLCQENGITHRLAKIARLPPPGLNVARPRAGALRPLNVDPRRSTGGDWQLSPRAPSVPGL